MSSLPISVIVTAHDRKQYLLEAIDSINKQTLSKEKFEVIIIKNYSDKTIDTFSQRFGYKNIVMGGTIGEKVAVGIRESKGFIITFLQDDDLFLPNRLEYIYTTFSQDCNIKYFHNGFSIIDEKSKQKQSRFYFVQPTRDYLLKVQCDKKHSILSKMLKRGLDFNLSSMAVSDSILKENLNVISNSMYSIDSIILLVSLARDNGILLSKNILTMYRFHESVSTQLSDYSIFLDNRFQYWYNVETELMSLRKITTDICYLPILEYKLAVAKMFKFSFSYGGRRKLIWSIIGIIKSSIRLRQTLPFFTLTVGMVSFLFGGFPRILYKGYRVRYGL